MSNTLSLYNALKESVRMDISALKRRGMGGSEILLAKRVLTDLELEAGMITMLNRITRLDISV